MNVAHCRRARIALFFIVKMHSATRTSVLGLKLFLALKNGQKTEKTTLVWPARGKKGVGRAKNQEKRAFLAHQNLLLASTGVRVVLYFFAIIF